MQPRLIALTGLLVLAVIFVPLERQRRAERAQIEALEIPPPPPPMWASCRPANMPPIHVPMTALEMP